MDSKSVPAPLGGEGTSRNPTDRGKSGSKIHLLGDQRGAPLVVLVSGASQHDKWSAGDLIFSIVVVRTSQQQNMCLDKEYDFDDVHEIVTMSGYIKHRRRRNEPPEHELAPEDKTFPAGRWVV
jgi:putative transposase